ncbi:uncharacterized protein Z518_09602 [Rhinocladiella mackenziei CBS 650.93]|uniref:DUF1868 domain-containing protein n=1 Tax=Rhinocladiella mackenziei CBS 650.93 TaxID=1442369 RepID=A0A0D2IZ18_9EURO|nr:uncharacterized protein Z518_09602 [Rhinocladiella mackenziei CBS 650.93]KIX01875.1 hypothetical protein Z518_09602 [Rhinocladiella mackenziei CBS 650.93]
MSPKTSVVANGTTNENSHNDSASTILTESHPLYNHKHRVEPELNKKEEYPRWIGQKFEPDGRLLSFPGNTVICHLSPQSELHHALQGLYKELKEGEFASLQALLPPTSWHMTIFEGVSDKMRKHGVWPDNLPPDASLDGCNALFNQKLAAFDLETEPPFRMAVYGFEPLEDGVALRVVPASPAEERRLRRLRDRLSKVLQTRHLGHNHYSFHVSVSYMLRYLSQEEHEKFWTFLQEYLSKLPEYFELGAPEFCTFDDMFAFRREFFLQKQS